MLRAAAPPVAPPTRSPTPPKVTGHKPPLPTEPPPRTARRRTGPAVADSAAAGAAAGAAATAAGAPRPRPQREGYLVKEGARGLLGSTSWKRRYVVLTDGEVSYFESREAHDRGEGAIKGNHVRVADFRVLESGADGADIVLEPLAPGERSWRFRCEARADVRAWVDALLAHGAARLGDGRAGGAARAPG